MLLRVEKKITLRARAKIFIIINYFHRKDKVMTSHDIIHRLFDGIKFGNRSRANILQTFHVTNSDRIWGNRIKPFRLCANELSRR